LEVDGELTVTRPAGFTLPAEDALLKECGGLIGKCKPVFADPAVTDVTWRPSKTRDKGRKGVEGVAEEEGE
jgi:hypothetical protein